MNILNQTFEKIWYINLKKRRDRREECEAELKRYGIVAERFEAICSRPFDVPLTIHEQGCILSHRSIVRKASKAALENVLILEDDFRLVPAPEEFEYRFYEFYKEVPLDWQMLYLGGNHTTWHPHKKLMTSRMTEHVLKCNFTLTTGAYALSKSSYPRILEVLESPTRQIDAHYAFLQSELKAYGAVPSLIVQRPSYSDIQERFVDYSEEGAIK